MSKLFLIIDNNYTGNYAEHMYFTKYATQAFNQYLVDCEELHKDLELEPDEIRDNTLIWEMDPTRNQEIKILHWNANIEEWDIDTTELIKHIP